ncbi:RNA polymerase sigma-70 factor, ECF subfamily [Roseateles sp. YR242]|uniref:sigma-70 family RNA polymerase sigma factor n=1 Tax=Roseateles sp. YR242 TaxID=1855305 RepID=UPI0008B78E51|nr:sigma-70 family RNA polymerase sigma factor [Roseateles sp. YR242]SEL61962.1 RNA polymerase sigma-70 factor, ECF subfamily [Roseateles sp. YR242]
MSYPDDKVVEDAVETSDLTEIFVTHRPRLRRIALAIVQNAQGADDVLQDAYLKLLGAQTALVVHQPLAYCCQIVRNMARDHLRRQTFEVGLLGEEEEGQYAHAAYGQPELQAMRRQNLVILNNALGAVPVRTRIAYEMYIVRGMTQRDISKALAVSVGLVNALIAEAADVLTRHRHLMAWD